MTTTNYGPGGQPTQQQPARKPSRAGTPLAQSAARTLPTQPRRQGRIALLGLLVVLCALLGWYLVSTAGHKNPVVVVTRAVAKGHVIDRSDLSSRPVAGVSDTIPAKDVDKVVGKTAATDLLAGEVLTNRQYSSAPVPAKGRALVGLALDPSNVPADGLEPGADVQVVAVPASNGDSNSSDSGTTDSGASKAIGGGGSLDKPTVLSFTATVYEVRGKAAQGGQVLVTLDVDAADSNRIAAYSTQGQVAIVETSQADAEQKQSGLGGGNN